MINFLKNDSPPIKDRDYVTNTFDHLSIFTNPSARAGYDTKSIFKRGLTGLNSEFSFC